MKNRVLQPASSNKMASSTASKISPKKSKYKLIMSIQQLKKPVLNVVQSIINNGSEKQNIIRNKRDSKTLSRSYAEVKHDSLPLDGNCNEKGGYGNASETEEYRKVKERMEFTEKVHRMFTSKKYNYATGNEEDNIDRLNAKLDKYISRYLHKHSTGLKIIA